MTPAAFLALVRTLTYKPGAWFETGYHDGPGAGVTYAPGIGVTAYVPVPDLSGGTRPYILPVPTHVSLAEVAGLDDAGACRLIRDRVLLPLETHELDEWFWRDGQPITRVPH